MEKNRDPPCTELTKFLEFRRLLWFDKISQLWRIVSYGPLEMEEWRPLDKTQYAPDLPVRAETQQMTDNVSYVSALTGESGADWVLAYTRTFSTLRRPDFFSFLDTFRPPLLLSSSFFFEDDRGRGISSTAINNSSCDKSNGCCCCCSSCWCSGCCKSSSCCFCCCTCCHSAALFAAAAALAALVATTTL